MSAIKFNDFAQSPNTEAKTFMVMTPTRRLTENVRDKVVPIIELMSPRKILSKR